MKTALTDLIINALLYLIVTSGITPASPALARGKPTTWKTHQTSPKKTDLASPVEAMLASFLPKSSPTNLTYNSQHIFAA
jgi:hypothetical protein